MLPKQQPGIEAGKELAVWFLGSLTLIKSTGESTNGAFGLIEQLIPAGFASPYHVHHLEDEEAKQLFQIAHDALKPGGKLVTVDGVWTRDQSPAARWLLARDRGEHVRSEPEYVGIASRVFGRVKPTVRHDLLRIPYSHMILECVR